MGDDRQLVRNAADPAQVRRAARTDRDRANLLRTHLRAALSTESGRFVFWDLLGRFGVYRSIWTPNAQIHYNAGRQDCGHELVALLVDADEDLYLTMEREARARVTRERRETEAAQTPRATTTREGTV